MHCQYLLIHKVILLVLFLSIFHVFSTVTVGVTAWKITVLKIGKETSTEKMLTCIWRTRFERKAPQRRDLQKKNIQNMGSRKGGARLCPHGWIAFTCASLPRLTQSLLQVINQLFRPWLNNSHTVHNREKGTMKHDTVDFCKLLQSLLENAACNTICRAECPTLIHVYELILPVRWCGFMLFIFSLKLSGDGLRKTSEGCIFHVYKKTSPKLALSARKNHGC